MQYFPLGLTKPQTVTLFKNKIFFGNKHDYLVVFPTWFAYISLSVLFLLTINEVIMDEISLGLGIFSYIFSVPGLFFAIKCFATDPGIVQRGNVQPPNDSVDNDIGHHSTQAQDIGLIETNNKEIVEELKELENQEGGKKNSEETNDSYTNENQLYHKLEGGNNLLNKPKEQQIMEAISQIEQQNIQNNKVRGNLLKQRYCQTCKIMRPPLSSHCSHCNNCVKNFDHHCYYMGNCVGERNQKYFVLFLISTTLWAIYVEAFTVYQTISAFQENSYIFLDLVHNAYLFYSMLFFFILTLITGLIRCHQCVRQWIFVGFVLDVVIILANSYFEYREVPCVDNPIICFAMIGIYLGVILFVLPQTVFNTDLACRNLTLKQEQFYTNLSEPEQTFSQASFSNFWKLVTRPQVKSEILS